jgi:riboflavin kinase/FMN adenylyltransferase
MTIGNFDGVHLAHQKIIRKVVAEAHEIGQKAVVMTFEPHPQKVLRPDQSPFYLITTLEEKMAVLESLGVDAAVVIGFSRDFAKTTAAEFIDNVICGKLHPKKILIGHDYTFGRGKEGKPEYLRLMGEKCGFSVEVIQAVMMNEGIVSSTRIRNAILNGSMEEAANLLGRPYVLSGQVIKGFQRGGELGFPTANIKPDKELMPPEGVYAVFVEINNKRHQAVANIGFNPTFANENLSLEIHIIDFCDDLYENYLRTFFIQKLRDEEKFENPDRLVDQIKKDIERARGILSQYPTNQF